MPFDGSEITDLFKFRLKTEDEWRFVPEPTETEMRKFRAAVFGAQLASVGMTEAEADEDDGEEFRKRLDALTYEQRQQLSEDVVESTIEFCKGTPSPQEIADMGALTRLGFVNWLLGVLSPLF